MAEDETRLADAVGASLENRLGALGYRLAGSQESLRGGWAELTNGTVLVTVHADWLEGALAVRVSVAGSRPVPIDRLVATGTARGLRLTRLPRGVKAGVLVSRLGEVADLLISQAADILEGDETGLARLQAAAATTETGVLPT